MWVLHSAWPSICWLTFTYHLQEKKSNLLHLPFKQYFIFWQVCVFKIYDTKIIHVLWLLSDIIIKIDSITSKKKNMRAESSAPTISIQILSPPIIKHWANLKKRYFSKSRYTDLNVCSLQVLSQKHLKIYLARQSSGPSVCHSSNSGFQKFWKVFWSKSSLLLCQS